GPVTYRALGGDDAVGSADWYSIDLSARHQFVIGTSTPAGGPNDFANTLDPRIELYDQAGNLVAAGVPGPDGRNETITFTPDVTGTYRVRVAGQSGTAGEYFLSVAV